MTFNTHYTCSYQPASSYKSFLLFSLFLSLSLKKANIKNNQMRLSCFVCLLLFLITVSVQLDETVSLRRDMKKLLEIQDKIRERLAVAPSLPPLSSPSSPFPKMVSISHISLCTYTYMHTCVLFCERVGFGLVWCRWAE